jgi:Fur family ferric uptake transcriptional regulator
VTKPSADHTQNTEGTAGKGALPAAAGEHKSARSGDTQSAIASIVKGLPKGTHLTAGEVYEKAKELGLDVSLSTVYRTLHRLKTHGDVSTVSGERGVRYEIHEEGENHDHLICLGCGLTESLSTTSSVVSERRWLIVKVSSTKAAVSIFSDTAKHAAAMI